MSKETTYILGAGRKVFFHQRHEMYHVFSNLLIPLCGLIFHSLYARVPFSFGNQHLYLMSTDH